jgi:hypothetical protein
MGRPCSRGLSKLLDLKLVSRLEFRSSKRGLHHFVRHPAQAEGIGLGDVLDRVTMQLFVRDSDAMIDVPVQGDVDGIPKGSHCWPSRKPLQ